MKFTKEFAEGSNWQIHCKTYYEAIKIAIMAKEVTGQDILVEGRGYFCRNGQGKIQWSGDSPWFSKKYRASDFNNKEQETKLGNYEIY